MDNSPVAEVNEIVQIVTQDCEPKYITAPCEGFAGAFRQGPFHYY
jgi:hypothetical protein